MMSSNPHDLKSFILNKKEPVILKNQLKWDMLNWNLEDWKTVLNKENLQFRSGVNEWTKEPQWERKTNICEGDFDFFLAQIENIPNEWLYFDYKQLNSWFKGNDKLRKDINWSQLGFPDVKPEDCTIWIGSKGAHTPCHMDCYGFNLVYQIYGKKLWLLYPPEENLQPTRVPYEESSIYSKLNFFSPQLKDFKGLENKSRKVVLNPGDVLLVPHKWWHYVENLETSISVNVWLPSVDDDEERLQESIIQFFIKQMTTLSNSEVNKSILNPNMDELILENSTISFFDTLMKCKKTCTDNLHVKKLKIDNENRTNPGTTKEYNFGETIPVSTKENFLSFLDQQNKRFSNFEQNSEIKVTNSEHLEFVESLTNPRVVNLIKTLLLKNKS